MEHHYVSSHTLDYLTPGKARIHTSQFCPTDQNKLLHPHHLGSAAAIVPLCISDFLPFLSRDRCFVKLPAITQVAVVAGGFFVAWHPLLLGSSFDGEISAGGAPNSHFIVHPFKRLPLFFGCCSRAGWLVSLRLTECSETSTFAIGRRITFRTAQS